MTTQLGQIYAKMRDQRAEARPHTAAAEEISGKFFGLVRHGGASSTTLPDAFDSAEKAQQHAQLICDGLNAADDHADEHKA